MLITVDPAELTTVSESLRSCAVELSDIGSQLSACARCPMPPDTQSVVDQLALVLERGLDVVSAEFGTYAGDLAMRAQIAGNDSLATATSAFGANTAVGSASGDSAILATSSAAVSNVAPTFGVSVTGGSAAGLGIGGESVGGPSFGMSVTGGSAAGLGFGGESVGGPAFGMSVAGGSAAGLDIGAESVGGPTFGMSVIGGPWAGDGIADGRVSVLDGMGSEFGPISDKDPIPWAGAFLEGLNSAVPTRGTAPDLYLSSLNPVLTLLELAGGTRAPRI